MMPDFADAFDTSLPGPAFSNGAEGETWMFHWCGSCAKSSDTFDGCALSDVAVAGRIPAAWVELEPSTPPNRWLCLSWVPAAGYVDLLNAVRLAH